MDHKIKANIKSLNLANGITVLVQALMTVILQAKVAVQFSYISCESKLPLHFFQSTSDMLNNKS